jgi:ABC-type transporter Mla subunit MlaD
MNPALLSLLMDFVVLVALAGTIYYAMRLSKALNSFKSHREELRGLIGELSSHIDQAQRAVISLKSASETAANDLDDVLHDSRRMAEELRMVNETGENLANRIEGLASRSAKAVQNESSAGSYEAFEDEYASDAFSESLREAEAPKPADKIDAPSFFIQDNDFSASDDDGLSGDDQEFSSQAERELYEALQKNKSRGGRN